MANTTESLIETILSEADHNDEADVNNKITCNCARCHTGELMEKYLEEFGLIVTKTSKIIASSSKEILNQFETVVRVRRTIQNDNNMFQSSKQVRKIRREREKQMKEEAIERKKQKEEEKVIEEFFEFDDDSEEPQRPTSLTRRKYKPVSGD